MDPFFAKKVPDVTVVPISITYDKTIEAELYSNELLGESKTKESFQVCLLLFFYYLFYFFFYFFFDFF